MAQAPVVRTLRTLTPTPALGVVSALLGRLVREPEGLAGVATYGYSSVDSRPAAAGGGQGGGRVR